MSISNITIRDIALVITNAIKMMKAAFIIDLIIGATYSSFKDIPKRIVIIETGVSAKNMYLENAISEYFHMVKK